MSKKTPIIAGTTILLLANLAIPAMAAQSKIGNSALTQAVPVLRSKAFSLCCAR